LFFLSFQTPDCGCGFTPVECLTAFAPADAQKNKTVNIRLGEIKRISGYR